MGKGEIPQGVIPRTSTNPIPSNSLSDSPRDQIRQLPSFGINGGVCSGLSGLCMYQGRGKGSPGALPGLTPKAKSELRNRGVAHTPSPAWFPDSKIEALRDSGFKARSV
jgi:hypothetical protein